MIPKYFSPDCEKGHIVQTKRLRVEMEKSS